MKLCQAILADDIFLLMASPVWPLVANSASIWENSGLNTLKGMFCGELETLFRKKKVDIYVQESRKRRGRRRIIKNKNSSGNPYWSENSKLKVRVWEVDREGILSKVSLRQIFRKIIARLLALCVISTHAQQCSVNDAVKDLYYDQLYAGTTSEFLISCGDWKWPLCADPESFITEGPIFLRFFFGWLG